MDHALKSAQLAMEAGRIAARDKRHRDAATLFQEALDQYEKMHDDECVLSAKSHLARQLSLSVGATHQALLAAEDCQRQCKVKSTTGIFLGSVYNVLGLAYMDCRAYPSATTVFLLALQYYKDANWLVEATINQNIGCAYCARSDYENGRRFHETAANMFLKHGYDVKASRGFLYVAWCYEKLKRHNMAREAYEMSLDAARRCDGRAAEWPVLQGLAATYAAEGQSQKAAEFYRKAFEACLDPRNGEVVSEHVKERLLNSLCKAFCLHPNPTSDQNSSADAGNKILEQGEAGDASILEQGEAGDASILEQGEAGDASILEQGEAGDASILEQGEAGDASILEQGEAGDASVSHHSNQYPQPEVGVDQDKDGSISDAIGSGVEGSSESESTDEDQDAHSVAEELLKYVEKPGPEPKNAYAPFERTERGLQSPLPQGSGKLTSNIVRPTHRVGRNDGDPSTSPTESDSMSELTDDNSTEELQAKPKEARLKSSRPLSETYETAGPSGLNYFRSQNLEKSNGLDHTYQTIDHLITNVPAQRSSEKELPGASNDLTDGSQLLSPSENQKTTVTSDQEEIRLPANDSKKNTASRSCTLL